MGKRALAAIFAVFAVSIMIAVLSENAKADVVGRIAYGTTYFGREGCNTGIQTDSVGVAEGSTQASWRCNMDPTEPHYRIGGEGTKTITLTPPSGYECDGWTVNYPYGGATNTGGTGCSATIAALYGDWNTHLWFSVKPPKPPPQCKDNDGDKYGNCPPKACGTGDSNTAGSGAGCSGKTTTPECNLVDVGSCKVKVCPKGWKQTHGGDCCQYGNYQTGSNYRYVEADDSLPGHWSDCDTDIKLKNSWSVSGSTITITTEAAKDDAAATIDAGFTIETVNNCQFSDGSSKKEEKALLDIGDSRTAQKSYTLASCPSAPADCDDANPIINPGSKNPYCNCNDGDGKKPEAEKCDGADNDCDSLVDEGFDSDGDGVTRCGGDCNDNDPTIYPGAPEKCDAIDHNCNGDPYDGVDADTCEELCTGRGLVGEKQRTVYTWVRDKCCGDDADENVKYSTEPCGTGCCGKSECYDAKTKGCVAGGKTSGDKYCHNGEWADRTNAVLAILEGHANKLGTSGISVLCGTYEEAINSYNYPILGRLAADYFRSPCIITNRDEPCSGELCVADIRGNVLVAGSLNFEPKPSELKELLGYDKECKTAFATDRTTLLPCNKAPDKLWYSKKTGIFIYSSEPFTPILKPDADEFEGYLNVAKRSHELDGKLYLKDKSGQTNGPMVSGLLYQSSCGNDGGTSETLEISYLRFGTNMCRATAHLGEGATCKELGSGTGRKGYGIFSTRKTGEYNSYFDAWLDLTAKLRIKKACPANCVCDEFNDIIECSTGDYCGDFSTNLDCYCNRGETKDCFSCPQGSVCAVADNCRCTSAAAACTTDKDCKQPLCPVSDQGISSCPTIKCVSGKCTSVSQPACTDSDGGRAIYEKGTVTTGTETRTDSCTSTRLTEYTCKADGTIGQEGVNCPLTIDGAGGCARDGGACLRV